VASAGLGELNGAPPRTQHRGSRRSSRRVGGAGSTRPAQGWGSLIPVYPIRMRGSGRAPQRRVGGVVACASAGLGVSDPCLPDQDEGKRPRAPAQGWGSRRLRQRSVKRDLRRANAGSGERSASSTSSRQRRSTTGLHAGDLRAQRRALNMSAAGHARPPLILRF
jgi:hypothetical protein